MWLSCALQNGQALKQILCTFKLAEKRVTPPFIPTDDPDIPENQFTSNFDSQFTGEMAVLTPDDP